MRRFDTINKTRVNKVFLSIYTFSFKTFYFLYSQIFELPWNNLACIIYWVFYWKWCNFLHKYLFHTFQTSLELHKMVVKFGRPSCTLFAYLDTYLLIWDNKFVLVKNSRLLDCVHSFVGIVKYLHTNNKKIDAIFIQASL